MQSVVIEDVKKGVNTYTTESSGPTVSIYNVKDDEEALNAVNDTDCGLTSMVYTEYLGRVLKIAGRIETATMHINGMTVHHEPSLPYGGGEEEWIW